MPSIPSFLLLTILAVPQVAAAQGERLIAFDHYHTLAEIEATSEPWLPATRNS